MHRNNQDNEGLRPVFGALAGLECWQGRSTAGPFNDATSPRLIPQVPQRLPRLGSFKMGLCGYILLAISDKLQALAVRKLGR